MSLWTQKQAPVRKAVKYKPFNACLEWISMMGLLSLDLTVHCEFKSYAKLWISLLMSKKNSPAYCPTLWNELMGQIRVNKLGCSGTTWMYCIVILWEVLWVHLYGPPRGGVLGPLAGSTPRQPLGHMLRILAQPRRVARRRETRRHRALSLLTLLCQTWHVRIWALRGSRIIASNENDFRLEKDKTTQYSPPTNNGSH